jgi:hypothetical protein
MLYVTVSCLKIIFFIEIVSKSFDWTWNLLAAQFVQEGHVSKETIFILRTWRNQFVQKVGTVLLGDFISYEIKKFEYVF